MGMFSFIKEAGEKLFGIGKAQAATPAAPAAPSAEQVADLSKTAGEAIAKSGRQLLYPRLGAALTQAPGSVAVRDHYVALFDAIKQRGLPAQVSVKPTQLGLDLSMDECLQHCVALADKAEATGSALWLDMEDVSYVDRTLELYRASPRLRREHF